MSTNQETVKNNNEYVKRKPGRPRLNDKDSLIRDEEKREKAKERYYHNKETCTEQSRENQRRYREFYRTMKELIKEGKVELPEDVKEKVKELLLLKD
jgi:hypothetical protein